MTTLTPEQQERAVRILQFVATNDGCSFLVARGFRGGTCAEENGKGFDCPSCAARALLKEVGTEAPR